LAPSGESKRNIVTRVFKHAPPLHVPLCFSWAFLVAVVIDSPAVRVRWRRVDSNGQLPVKSVVQSYGRELMITDVDESVAGTYECSAVNERLKSAEPISARFQLVVECKLLRYSSVIPCFSQ